MIFATGVLDVWGQEAGNRSDNVMTNLGGGIQNPSFANSSFNGWNGKPTNPTLGGIGGYINAQKIGERFDVYQVVQNLSKGLYSLEVQAFYQGSTTGQSYLYASTGGNEVTDAIMSIHSDANAGSELFNSGHANGVGGSADTWSNEGNGFIPTCQQGASAYFNERHYMANIVWIYLEKDDTLRVGIKNNGSEGNDWTCFDNFKLTSYGSLNNVGDYFLRNRASEKFLTQGNAWGTQATLSDNVGIEFAVMNNGSKYVFDSKIQNVSHYLNGNGYVDSNPTVFEWTQRDDNYYTLSEDGTSNFLVPGNGTTAVFTGNNFYDWNAQWQLVSRQDLIDELRKSGASEYNPKDATILISASTFNNFDTRKSQWQGSPAFGGYTGPDGSNYCAEKFNQSGDFDVYQTLTGLPDGVYTLKAQAFYRAGAANANGSSVSNARIYASGGGSEVSAAVPTIYSQAGANGQPTSTTGSGNPPAFSTNQGLIPNNISGAATAFANGLYQTETIKVTVTGGTLRLGIKSNGYVQYDWTAFDNFQLQYLGAATIPPLTSTYTGSGSYYLQNVATGEYLQGGLAYGTKAVLGNGIAFDIQKTGNGCHTLSSGIWDNGHDYLCSEASLDHIATEFAIQTVSDGIYTIATTANGCNNNNVTSINQGNLFTAQTTDLSTIAFNQWEGPSHGSGVVAGSNHNINNGTLNGGETVYGSSNVKYTYYSDISAYQSLRLKATPDTKLRVLLNRTKDEGTVAEGALVEVVVTIGEDGWGTADLTPYEYVHLHAIKVHGESAPSQVTQLILCQTDKDAVTFSGSDSSNPRSQWRLVTEEERRAGLSSATEAHPVDATFWIKDASFTVGDENEKTAWTSATGAAFQVYRDWNTQSDGTAGFQNIQSGVDVSQQLSGLPNGVYEISMEGCHKNGNNAQFYANNESVGLPAAGSEVTDIGTASAATYGNDNYKVTLRVTVTDGNLKIGVRADTPSNTGDNLLVFDNFKLTYLGVSRTVVPYYVRNVATGEFIRAGGRYEAQAIADEWGLQLDFVNKGSNVYSIDTRVSNGGANQYLGTNGFMDSAETDFTVTPVGNHNGYQTYTILAAEGSYLTAPTTTGGVVEFKQVGQSPDAYSQWELITRSQLITELRNSNASDANPKDATFLIQSPNFGRHDLRTNTDYWKDVSFTIADGSEYGGVESTDWNSPDNYANRCVEKWNKTFDVYQDLTNLPAGVYELTVQAFYRSGEISDAVVKDSEGTDLLRPFVYVKQGEQLIGQKPFLSIMDANVGSSNGNSGFTSSAGGEYIPNSKSDAAKAFRDGYYMTDGDYNKVRFVVTQEGATVRIGVKKNVLYAYDWSAFDNFRLTYLGNPQNGETQKVYTTEIGTTLGTFYLRNTATGTFLTAGGSDGVSAALGDKMHQRAVYNEEYKYNQYTTGNLSGQLKGVRETDFTFTVVRGDEYAIQTGIGGGFLTRDGGAKLNGKCQTDKSLFRLKQEGDIYYILHVSGQENRYLRYSTNSGITDTEIPYSWSFNNYRVTSDAAYKADATNWTDGGDGRYTYNYATNGAALMLSGIVLPETKGLLFTAEAGRIMMAPNQYLRVNGSFTLSGLKAGQTVTIMSQSPNQEQASSRMLAATNLNVTEGFRAHEWGNWMTNKGTVQSDGDVTITTSGGGLNIISIQVSETVNSSGVGFELSYYQDDNYKWRFLTRQDLLNEFATASEDNPIDATFLLRGTSFHKEDSRNSAWTGNPEIVGDGSNHIGRAAARTFDISQKITDAPAGVYEYTLQGYYIGGDEPQTDVHYYASTDQYGKNLITKNYPNGGTTLVNSKNYSTVNSTLVWSENFQSDMSGNFSYTNSFTTAGGSTVKNVQIGSRSINPNLGLPEYQVTYNANGSVKSTTEWRYQNSGLYAASSGPRVIGFSNLQAGQIVKLRVDDISAFSAADNLLDLIRSVDGEVVFRVIKSGNAGVNVTRYHYIYEISVHTEQTSTPVDINNASDAATQLADINNEKGTHPVIRFKVNDGDVIRVGAFNTVKKDGATFYIDNVRLTYLGTSATGEATPTTITKGIVHKRSRFYELAEANGHLTFTDYNTVAGSDDADEKKTTLSNKTMVAHEHVDGRKIQHTPVYREVIYAQAGQKLEIVLPSSYTNKNQGSNRYYQRIYDYKTDDLFVEDATNTGVFDFTNGSHHTDERIRNYMRVYEGTPEAPAGGWVIGERWGQYLVSLFNYTTPTNFTQAVEIGVDHGDFTDVGDMDMFGNLTEPTLSQRLIYVVTPAQVMVDKLNNCTGDVFLEEKSISFPTIWYGNQEGMNPNDLNAVALDMTLKNYFTHADTVPVAGDFTISLDPAGTGISLATTEFGGNGERFIKFNYPASGEVINYKDQTAVITVTSNGKNIARFKLHFVPNTELRPWKDIIGQSHLRRSPVYLEEHAVLMDELNFDNRYEVTYPNTWPVGEENTAINGVEVWKAVSSHDQFNPYPLDFDQTSFAANYFNAIWGQYSVMKSVRIPSYKDIRPFKDVNQLYYDHYGVKGNASQQHIYPGNGYFMYIDASNFPSSIATLALQEDLCAGTTIHFSGWVSSMDLSKNSSGNNNGNAPGYLLFSIMGKKSDGTEEVVEAFCPGPIRADAMEYAAEGVGTKVTADSYNNEVWGTGSNSIWQQFAFSFVIKPDVADKYHSYALKIDNYCSNTSGGDMMVDDVRLYIQKAVPDIMQNSPICSTGDLANDNGVSMMEIYTTFDKLVGAVNMTEAQSEETAYNSYVNKSGGSKIIPAGWYCFLDKEVYDAELDKITDHNNTALYDAAFNAALVTNGGEGGYHRFDFSTHFESNDGGVKSYTHGSQHVTYMARGETVTTEEGEVRYIYLNPTDCAVSLRELTYYENAQGTTIANITEFNQWVERDPDWNMGTPNTTIYGSYMGEKVHYVDLAEFDELRIYQTDLNPDGNDTVRCFFFDMEANQIKADNVNTNLTVSSKGKSTHADLVFDKVEYGNEGEFYWSVDLNKVKKKTGGVAKLIAVKGYDGNSNITSTVTAINAVRKAAVLEAEKDYYIVFRAYKGETGTISEGGVSSFFQLGSSAKCAAMASFSLVSGTELRYDGTLASEQTSYCTGQIATLKMELLSVSNSRSTLKDEDLFYDWWMGDITSFSTKEDGKPDSPQGVLFDFRDAYYGTATVYDGQPAKGDFSDEDRAYLEELVKNGDFVLYQSSLNAKVKPQAGKKDMYVTVMPIVAQLEALTGLPYCRGPLEVNIPVLGTSPTVKDGFNDVTYPMEDVPVRIGLSQLKKATDEAGNKWVSTTSSLYVPLRNIVPSGDGTKSFAMKKKGWTDATDLEIAAVYLAETDDPDMVSYGADIDKEGNRELRYVGKVHTFSAAAGRGKFEDYVQLTFNPEFTDNVKEGYRYTLKTSFVESDANNVENKCHGDLLIPLYIVPEYQVWAGGADGNWANDDNWRRADNAELKLAAGNKRPTNEQNTTSRGFVPMTFTHVLMKSDSIATLQSVTKLSNGLVDFSAYKSQDGTVDLTDRTIPTSDIAYHMAAQVKAPTFSWFPQDRSNDIYCEPFYTNTAKEVHFEPRSQMKGSQHLTYEKAWVEYALESGRWYTLSSPLKGVVSGDMYLPRGTVAGGAKQQTPYFTNIDYNNTDYTRLAPAVYQQAWDKAEATTYRLERNQLVGKLPPYWEYKTATVNVARAFDWSREYNDVKVPFGLGGFSVKVDMDGVREYEHTDDDLDVLLRLPKNDKAYHYYLTDDNTNGSQTVDLTTTAVDGKNLRENAGKLFTDDMTDEGMTVTLTNNSAENPYFLVGNPFMTGLDLDKFFAGNTGLETKYWILSGDSYETGLKEATEWLSTNEKTSGTVAPLQAFVIKKQDGKGGTLTVKFTEDMSVNLTEKEDLLTRAAAQPATLRITALRDGVESHATIVCSEQADPAFKAGEDAEVLFDSHLGHAPVLYTMAGDVAAAINVCRSLHGLPVGSQSEDDAKVYWTFNGVEQFDEEIYLYDAESGESAFIPSSGTTLLVSGQSLGRYYLVNTPIDGSATDPAPRVSVDGDVVSVVSLSDEIETVVVHDVPGRRVHSETNAGTRTAFTLSPGVYMVSVKTANHQIVRKVQVR